MDIEDIIENGTTDEKLEALRKDNSYYTSLRAFPAQSVLKKLIETYTDNDLNLLINLSKRSGKIPEEIINILNPNLYTQLSKSSYDIFIKLVNLNHKYKDLEQKIFSDYYEQNRVLNENYYTNYELESPIVLLNTIKENPYLVSNFKEKAYTDEIIDYIIKNKIYKINFTKAMGNNNKILIEIIKEDINNLKDLKMQNINENLINYLKEINFNLSETNYKLLSIAPVFNHPLFIKFLLEQNINNIKYYTERTKTDKYKEPKNSDYTTINPNVVKILESNENILNSLINKGNLVYILTTNINLNDNQINNILKRIENCEICVVNIQNRYILNSNIYKNYMEEVKRKYDININPECMLDNSSKALNFILKQYLPEGTINLIKNNICNYHTEVDLLQIFKYINPKKYMNIYYELQDKNRKTHNFDLFYFIKVTKYFNNNIDLLKGLNKDDNIDTTSLSLLINDNYNTNYDNYTKYFKTKKDMLKENYNKEYAIKMLTGVNIDSAKKFITKTITKQSILAEKLLTDNIKHKELLEIYYQYILLLEKIIKEPSLDKNISEEIIKIAKNPMFNLDNMKNIILKIMSTSYTTNNKITQKNINGKNIKVLDDINFSFFTHNPHFNDYEDMHDIDTTRIEKRRCYICTTYETAYNMHNLYHEDMLLFELKDPRDLIAYGYGDISIDPTNGCEFTSIDEYINPLEMPYNINGPDYAPNEFDFLRNGADNFEEKYITTTNLEKALNDKSGKYIYIDTKAIEAKKQQEYYYLINNIDNLSFKDIYKLILITKDSPLDENIIANIYNKLDNEQKLVISNLFKKYNYNINKKYINIEENGRNR